jgi:hypothetical protein
MMGPIGVLPAEAGLSAGGASGPAPPAGGVVIPTPASVESDGTDGAGGSVLMTVRIEAVRGGFTGTFFLPQDAVERIKRDRNATQNREFAAGDFKYDGLGGLIFLSDNRKS